MYRYINTKGETVREWMGTKSVGHPAWEAEDEPEYTENISQVRFRKEDAYTRVLTMAIDNFENGKYIETLAEYEFGENAGTTSYYEIPSGTFYPEYYYVSDDEENSGWYYALNEQFYNFVANKKYTYSCGDDGTYLIFTITLDGTANTPAKVVAQKRILKSEIVKEKMLLPSRH